MISEDSCLLYKLRAMRDFGVESLEFQKKFREFCVEKGEVLRHARILLSATNDSEDRNDLIASYEYLKPLIPLSTFTIMSKVIDIRWRPKKRIINSHSITFIILISIPFWAITIRPDNRAVAISLAILAAVIVSFVELVRESDRNSEQEAYERLRGEVLSNAKDFEAYIERYMEPYLKPHCRVGLD